MHDIAIVACLLSEERITKVAMSMYALSTVPLIQRLESIATKVWFADDAAAAGSLIDLLDWWKQLSAMGSGFGYHENASKVITDDCSDIACHLFAGTSLQITTKGHLYLGAPLRSPEFVSAFIQDKVSLWRDDVLKLSNFGSSQPHAAYSALVHGLSSRWTF